MEIVKYYVKEFSKAMRSLDIPIFVFSDYKATWFYSNSIHQGPLISMGAVGTAAHTDFQ